MRLECKLAIQTSKNPRDVVGRPVKGFVAIGRSSMKGSTSLELKYFTEKNKTNPPLPLTSPPYVTQHTKFISAGRLTIVFGDICIFISDCDATRLQTFSTLIVKAVKGESIQLQKIDKVKSTDFAQPKTIRIENGVDLEKWKQRGYPSTIESLSILNCRTHYIDAEWFSLKKLTKFDLSNTQFNYTKSNRNTIFSKFSLLYRLKLLKDLNLSGTNVPPKFLEFPISLISLNLSNNPQVTYVPSSVYKLQNLRIFRVANCKLPTLPAELTLLRRLKVLDICGNTNISYIPNLFLSLHLDEFYMEGCNFINDPDSPPDQYIVPSLFASSLAVVEQERYPHELLPWTVNIYRRFNIARCFDCFTWYPISLLKKKFVTVYSHRFSTTVDYRGAVPVLQTYCSPCQKYHTE